jgi:hypothetical protein
MRSTYYTRDDKYRDSYPLNFKDYTIGYLIDAFPFEIEKMKSEGRFYLTSELMSALKQAMEIARKPKQKNINQLDLF